MEDMLMNIPASRPRSSPATSICMLLLVFILACILTACGDADATNELASPAAASQPGEAGLITTVTIPTPTLVPTPGSGRSSGPDAPATRTPLPTIAAAAPKPTATSQATPAGQAGGTIGSEILFLRANALLAYGLETGEVRQLATDVIEFAATPDGRRLALVRTSSARTVEVWLMARDGSGLRQATRNARDEGSLSWAPDGVTLAYAAAETRAAHPLDRVGWATWCGSSQVRVLDIASGSESVLGVGCDPAFSNDGRRIAFATPPEEATLTGADIQAPTARNAIRLVNRQGENGWDFATAGGTAPAAAGELVYRPTWSPDSSYLAYHRFMGYQALVDINYVEMGGSFRGAGDLLGQGAGWLQSARFTPAAPADPVMVVVAHNFSDARGLQGYAVWSAQVLQTGQTGEMFLPSGTRATAAIVRDELNFATAAAWSPVGNELVVALPSGWTDALDPNDPLLQADAPGELWRWVPGDLPTERLVEGVDFATPLLWLPPL